MPSIGADIIAPYLQPGEVLRMAFPAFVGMMFGRAVVGVTDRRLIMVKSRFGTVSDAGLLWADPLEDVALNNNPILWISPYADIPTGKTKVMIRRADGTKVRLIPSSSFLSWKGSVEENLERLYSLVPGRY